MNGMRIWGTRAAVAVLALLVLAVGSACSGGDDDDETATPTATQTVVATPSSTSTPAATPTGTPVDVTRTLEAGVASISLDGDSSDWAAIDGIAVPLSAIPEDYREDPTAAEDVTATLKVATDGANVYVLIEVPDGYDYDPENHRRSPAIGVEWQIDDGATPQMGATGDDLSDSSGLVDIWHWELDCGPGVLSGGSFPSGNDPLCNLDDEYATLSDEREDDEIETSITGSWDHTARAEGIGAAGTFVFEMARPLDTGDPRDAAIELGGVARIALAYWDGNEGREEDGGWTDAGHAVSIEADEGLDGWIEVVFPEQAVRELSAPSGVTITLDGDAADWAGIPGLQVPLRAIPEDLREDPTAAANTTATLKVATGDSNVYVLVMVPDSFSYDPENHRLSPALGVEWAVDAEAGAGMGALAPDYDESGGLVDIWHWELDCGPGELSGGTFPSGNDPTCNLDDEYATLTDEREDDEFESSITGSWEHTARASGIGAPGFFIFELARPLVTDDERDAQLAVGESALIALAYWDGDEGREEDGGWTDGGHAVSALDDWIVVHFAP